MLTKIDVRFELCRPFCPTTMTAAAVAGAAHLEIRP